MDVSCPFPSWDGGRDISLPWGQFLQLPWVAPTPRETQPLIPAEPPSKNPPSPAHRTNSSAVFNTPGSPQFLYRAGVWGSARPGRAPAARPVLPSRLRPCRSPRRSSPGSAPPTCSLSVTSPSHPRPLPVHPTHRAAGLITGRHPAAPRLLHRPSPSRRRRPALPSETSPGAASPEGSSGHFRGRPEHHSDQLLPASSQVKVNKDYLTKFC